MTTRAGQGAALGLALAALITACPEKPVSSATGGGGGDARSSLRVPLPDGWRAAAVTGGLQAGPGGRVVLQLESTNRELPKLPALIAPLEADGLPILQKESMDSFVGVRYGLVADGGSGEGFLGVRKAGPRTIWCSTSANASAPEVEAAMTVCRSLTWEG